MHLLCLSISHQTTDLTLRERVSLDDDAAAAVLNELSNLYPNAEFAVVATCNRTEIYTARPLHDSPAREDVVNHLAQRTGIDEPLLNDVTRFFERRDVVEHLFCLTSGLDSMVLGEYEIVAQVRRALQLAQQQHTIGPALRDMFEHALAASKHVRTETGIGTGRVSVSSVAVDFVRHLFASLSDKTLLTIGAGKMAEQTLRHFAALNPQRLIVANRSPDRARHIAAQHGAEPADLEQLPDLLVAADVVITSTSAREPIITAESFAPLVRRRRFRPLFIVDIAVPRDVDPAVGRIQNVYLHDLDALQHVVAETYGRRESQIAACHAIIDPAVTDCYDTIQSEDFSELIQRLRLQLHEVGQAELRRTTQRLAAAAPEQTDAILEQHTQRLINKILHRPLTKLGKNAGQQAALYATALRRFFDLDRSPDQPTPQSPRRDPPEPVSADPHEPPAAHD